MCATGGETVQIIVTKQAVVSINTLLQKGVHGTQHLVFRLSHFNVAIFLVDNFYNCLNKKKRSAASFLS